MQSEAKRLMPQINMLGGANISNNSISLFNSTITFAFISPDLNGDRSSDILLINLTNETCTKTEISEISALNGSNARMYSSALAFQYPAGNLTRGPSQDGLIEAISVDNNETVDNMTAELTAVRSIDRFTLWNKSFNNPVIGVPNKDLDGDGKDDLLIYALNLIGDNYELSLAKEPLRILAVSSRDGNILWMSTSWMIMPFDLRPEI